MNNDFENAFEYIQKEFSPEEVKEILSGVDDIKKSAVILNLGDIINQEIADLLIFNLTNQSGPVREACAYKISEIINDNKIYFQSQKTLDIIVASLNDVNPNVVRFMLNSLKFIDNKNYIFEELMKRILKLSDEIKNKNRRGKAEEHIFTKKCFKIYWALESIKVLILKKSDIIYADGKIRHDFFNLIKELSDFEEYTIREKVAQIVNTVNSKEFDIVKDKLKKDSSYFVNRY